jgi:hypothetical protein
MRLELMLIALTVAAAGCASPTPTPTLAPTTAPTSFLSPTLEPSATLLPPTTTGTPEASATETPQPTAGVTRVAPTSVTVQYKYRAPVVVGPTRPTVYKNGNDITFTYEAVGHLAANYCYLLHVDMINPNVNPGNRGDDFLDKDHCADQKVSGTRLSFILYRGKFGNLPNYGTIMSEAMELAPLTSTQLLRVTWFVRVVQNNGLSADKVHYRVVPLSPPSAVLDFDFEP